MDVLTLVPLMGPLTNSTAIYEYRSNAELPENDSLTWVDEEIGDEENGPWRSTGTSD